MTLRRVTLELSLKPFGADPTEAGIRRVAAQLFGQWAPLWRLADEVAVLLWLSDGSEILDYDGRDETPFEWARYLGGANPRWRDNPNDPDKIGLHSRWYLYMDEPPVLTYGWLRRFVALLREVGEATCGRPVRIGETFDPGPEFAVSSFKYERHNEICVSGTLGQTAFVNCYGTLGGDTRPYAGWPDGIPDGLDFGTFFGRQCQHFLGDLGFDYLWLSNGFGFGTEPWGLRGATFDGQGFQPDRAAALAEECLGFWQAFRAECPEFPLEVRGTNLSTGLDLASDAVPLAPIYRGGFDLEPPPNSPWAALNGDFGIELVGWMSHIAELPGETYPFRFYLHDPWWLNSPWLDRYGREPHDIYLPLAVSRIDAAGQVHCPTAVALLSCDDSYGQMPDQVPLEVQPHLLAALREAPDSPGPVVWVYPFDEYHDWTFGRPSRVDEVFFGDWLVRGAVNAGLPLNTVCSTANLAALLASEPAQRGEPVLLSPVPPAGSDWSRQLLEYVDGCGDVLLYGPLETADEAIWQRLLLQPAPPLEGEFEVLEMPLGDWLSGDGNPEDPDDDTPAQYARTLIHDPLVNGGGLAEAAAGLLARVRGGQGPMAVVGQGREERVIWAIDSPPDASRGVLSWVRGTVTGRVPAGGHLLTPRPASQCFPAERLLRWALTGLGYAITALKPEPDQADPLLCVSRHDNGWFFSGYQPDTTVSQAYSFRSGAPLLIGCETWLAGGESTWTMPRAWHRECRVFVEQETDARLSCREVHAGMVGVHRRLQVTGLQAATVRCFPPLESAGAVRFLVNGAYPYVVGDFREPVEYADAAGQYLEINDVTGTLLISW